MSHLLSRFTVIGFAVGFAAAPPVVLAVNEMPPEINPICWQEADCVKARSQLGVPKDEAVQGWVTGEAPCDKTGWGKCLPAGKSKTAIAFGGKTEFTHIGDFIKTNYDYAIAIAGIVAVVIIIVAGVQWVTSGGNSESITAAKKRIGGALIGLLLVYFSYVILNTINPALVNLRLPQVFMVRSTAMVPQYCYEMPSSTMFAPVPVGTTDLPTVFSGLSDSDFFYLQQKSGGAGTPSKKESEFVCGQKFFVRNAGGLACSGHFCGLSKACIPNSETLKQEIVESEADKVKDHICYPATVVGYISDSSFSKPLGGELSGEDWEDPPTDVGETKLWAICKDGETNEVSSNVHGFDLGGEKQMFILVASKSSLETQISDCGAGLKGFALMMEMNEAYDSTDEEHLIGKGSGGEGVDLGDEGWFDDHGYQLPDKYFFTEAEIKSPQGVQIKIDANDVHDIDDTDKDRQVYMKLFK